MTSSTCRQVTGRDGKPRLQRVPSIGSTRFILEHISGADAEAVARKNGWDGGEGLLDYCDAGMAAATYTEHRTLDEAIAAARASMADGLSLFGCAIIDEQRFEKYERCPAAWETQRSWEVDADGESMAIRQ